MKIEFLELFPAVVSAIAACFSAYFAIKSQRITNRSMENKLTFLEISELIETLKIAKAIRDHYDNFSDAEIELGANLSQVPAKIAKLIQHRELASKINKSEWNNPININSLEEKIESLIIARKSLF